MSHPKPAAFTHMGVGMRETMDMMARWNTTPAYSTATAPGATAKETSGGVKSMGEGG
ncbi:hypothetical protein [Actinomadura opuntiae]|uniref:hypothetical protein n=1 Tax=Actinomadura sp. OS1-43 TaxID=604315 RepID=UPI00255AF712|nr:hypothetical protein [Actinomadura sp. OS1-43]MDL4818578.1 hypothetical protein [Actinomadura sp. OS1-43]